MPSEKSTSLKSSYELAMERLAGKDGAQRTLTPEQKKSIAEADRKVRAKIAELEIMLASRLAEAGDDLDKIEKLRSEHQSETSKIREKAEEEKEKVRKG
jgi:hypothetical protein